MGNSFSTAGSATESGESGTRARATRLIGSLIRFGLRCAEALTLSEAERIAARLRDTRLGSADYERRSIVTSFAGPKGEYLQLSNVPSQINVVSNLFFVEV
jgi:hypothetical protein